MAACARWFAEHREGKVTLLGQLTGATLRQAWFVDDDGAVLTDRLESARRRLEAKIVDKVRKASRSCQASRFVSLWLTSPRSRAADFLRFHLLMR